VVAGQEFPDVCAMGPWIVSKDELADPHTLDISLTIGGEKLQDSNTSRMIFKVPALIEYISGIVPLQAGDVISTGTPAGWAWAVIPALAEAGRGDGNCDPAHRRVAEQTRCGNLSSPQEGS